MIPFVESLEGSTMTEHLELGNWGERIAANFLSEKKWKILEKNLRLQRGEIDIVAMDGKELVVVEVRTRTLGRILPPEATVGHQKLRKLVRSGEEYVMKNNWQGPWRIDLVAITINNDNSWDIEHFTDISVGEFRS